MAAGIVDDDVVGGLERWRMHFLMWERKLAPVIGSSMKEVSSIRLQRRAGRKASLRRRP
jgi:hypothetical protein